MLEIQNLRRSYGDVDALGGSGLHNDGGVDLTVADGDIVGVLGPSGSGKTTLLRIIAGLEEPDGGTVLWDGHDLAGVPPDTRGFGLMFQDHVLFPHRDVAGNVGFGLRMQGVPAVDIERQVAEVLATVGLDGTQSRSISTLSGGEQQRVALARAFAASPPILLADEPTGNLDSATGRAILELIIGLRREATTMVLVTHDPQVAAMADRAVHLRDGRVERDEMRPAA